MCTLPRIIIYFVAGKIEHFSFLTLVQTPCSGGWLVSMSGLMAQWRLRPNSANILSTGLSVLCLRARFKYDECTEHKKNGSISGCKEVLI